MPVCNMCEKKFDVDKKPGAIFISSPDKDGFCWKAHLCQDCEQWVTHRFQIQPLINKEIDEQ